MSSLDSILGEIERQEKKRKGKRPSFENPLDRVGPVTAARATKDTTLAGQDKRKTIYLPPAAIEAIDDAAKQEGLAIKDMYRWLIEMGWEAYQGGERPVVEQQVTKAKIAQREW